MVKIKIPERDSVKVVEAEEGDLALLVYNTKLGYSEAGIFGVFEGVVNHAPKKVYGGFRKFYYRDYIRIGRPMLLKPCIDLGGEKVPIIEIPTYYKPGFFDFAITRLLGEVYAGQDEVIRQFQNWPGFEAHAEWISRLRKPYLEN